jgi:hypothetical protein
MDQYLREAARESEWATFRANNGRTAHIAGKGRMTEKPSLLSVTDIGCYERYYALRHGDEHVISMLPDDPLSNKAAEAVKADWNLDGLYYDVYGTGEKLHFRAAHQNRIVRLFPERAGLQEIEAYELAYEQRQADSTDGVRVWDYSSGKRELLFDRTFPVYIERPQVLAADMTGNGIPDIIVSGWDGTVVYSREGEYLFGIFQKDQPDWHKCRKRGYVGAWDVNGDGLNEIVITSCLQWHCDMLKNNGRELSVGWYHLYEDDTGLTRRMTYIPYQVVMDFDGDGKMEVLANVWNELDDHLWHATFYDEKGNRKYDVPGRLCYYAEDIDGDGKPELFCTRAEDLAVPDEGVIELLQLREGRCDVLVSMEAGWSKARWRSTPDNMVAHTDGTGCMGEIRPVTAQINGEHLFFTRRTGDGGQTIDGYVVCGGKPVRRCGLRLPKGTIGKLERARDGALLLSVSAGQVPKGDLSLDGLRAEPLALYRRPYGAMCLPICADIDNDGRNEILSANQAGQILCLNVDDEGQTTIRWLRDGGGMAWQYYTSIDFGLAADDLNGDGKLEILYRTSGSRGGAIGVLNSDGQELWRREFPDINGGEINGWVGNVAFFGTADLGRGYRDVVVTVQRAVASSARTYCLDGRTGDVIHELKTAKGWLDYHRTGKDLAFFEGGAGGFVMTCANLGDGHDTIACGYGNHVWAMDGKTGEIKFMNMMTSLYNHLRTSKTPSIWVQCIIPLAVPLKNGGYAYFHSNAKVCAGLQKPDGTMVWTPEEVQYLAREWQCLIDPTGEGQLYVAEMRRERETNQLQLDLLDYETGRPVEQYRYTFTGEEHFGMGWSSIQMAACDIDGDGGDELILNDDAGITCISFRNETAAPLWTVDDTAAAPPILAGLTPKGDVKLIYSTRDGYLKIWR